MNRDENTHRFDELDAGHALGDLDRAESTEWATLSQNSSNDPALERLATELELSAIPRIEMPAGLAQRLKTSIPAAEPEEKPVSTISILPWLGWGIAACLAGVLGVSHLKQEPSPDLAEQRADLLQNAPDVQTSSFAGASPAYETVSGTVVWSDARQQGFMTLSNLSANNPAQKQYQLWIVDPTRDEIPVDGGVFDIPTGSQPVVIPVHAKLPVNHPAAFVITLEKPGGVVQSKQETVVALAKF
jgi:hypothetical protein